MNTYKVCLVFLFFLAIPISAYQAVCIVPVADLLGESMQNIKYKPHAVSTYASIPYAENGCTFGCPRIHQLLFNEIVNVQETVGNEVLIALPNLYYHTTADMKRYNLYWTHKNNIRSLSSLKKNGISLNILPQPISYESSLKQNQASRTIVLAKSYYHAPTHRTFSAGTRFILSSSQPNEKSFHVNSLNTQAKNTVSINIPRTHAFIHGIPTKKVALNRFVTIVRSWATIKNGQIPYVWGGCSVGLPCKKGDFIKKDGAKRAIFAWPNKENKQPKEGVDCAGLVARATQLAGLPYYYKNTTTLANGLKEIKKGEAIENGDLIWIRGHVMIVSDKDNNLLVEARHYNHGYGIVHEIPLSEEFKGIKTYNDLLNASLNKKPFTRTNKYGKEVQRISECKILKMKSIFT